MLDKSLEIFMETINCGSFSKAAERLYITHTAVIKQINNLENRVGVQLLRRSKHGVKPTRAGETFYKGITELTRLSQEIIKRVRAEGELKKITLRVGTSALSPCQDFLEFWQQGEGDNPRFLFRIVPFSDDRRRQDYIGREFDFMVAPFDSPRNEANCHFMPIGRYPFVLHMSRNHRLAGKKSLKLRDLGGERIMIMKPGTSPNNDLVRQVLERDCPTAQIVDILPLYNMETFNYCAECETLLLSPVCWEHIHPALTAVPLDEDFAVPYGVIAAKELSADMGLFWEALKDRG